MKIFDTLSGIKKELPSHELIKIYSCGPTTYAPMHLGNIRALLIGDLLHRVLIYLNYEVLFVRNFTDIDDKILKAAKEQNKDPLLYSQFWIKDIQDKVQKLNLLPVKEVKVSEHLTEIIEFIQELIHEKFAYEVQGEVFFSVKSFTDYGKLSKKKDLIENFRIQLQEHKKDQRDFVLWKPDLNYGWDSPWGKGRPGWHIECSALIKKYLGDTIHVHHGGQDLIFPHHENEIAQSECLTHAPLSSIWMHHAFVIFNEEKMSKSLGHNFSLEELEKNHSLDFIRFLFLHSHYQDPIYWTESWVLEKKSTFTKIETFLNEDLGTKSYPQELEERFKNYLKDNFNVAGALSIIFEMIHLGYKEDYKREEVKVLLQKVFGFTFHQQDIPPFLHDLAQKRLQAKKGKNFKLSDQLRKEIEDQGYEVMDLEDSYTLRKL